MNGSNHPQYLEGIELMSQSRWTDAIACFGLALVDEENPYIYSNRAVCYLQIGQSKEAMHDFDHAITLQPDAPFHHSCRAYAHEMIGETEQAITDYRKAIELDPEDAIAHNNLGLLQEKKGWHKMAESNFKRADELSGAPPAKPSNPEPHVQEKKQGTIALMAQVFYKKRIFKDFIRFVANGFKS